MGLAMTGAIVALWSVNAEHWKQGTWLALSQIDQFKNAPIGFENDHL